MKTLIWFIVVLVALAIWKGLLNMSFYLMTKSDDLSFYFGFVLCVTLYGAPILYFWNNIRMFLRNMKGVFFDK
jgi:hypothetical protein